MNAPDGFIEDLIVRHHDRLQKRCARIVHYDSRYLPMVDDCIQEAYCKAYYNYERIAKSDNHFAWLVRCCENYFNSKIRRNIRRTEITGTHVSYEQCGDTEDPMSNVLRWLARMDALDTLHDFLETLTPLELGVFKSYYQKNLSLQATAQNNDISVVSARAAVDRIKKKRSKITFFAIIFSVTVYFGIFTHCIG